MTTLPVQTPINAIIVKQEIEKMGLKSIGLASIRELNRIVNNIETASNQKYIRMEMGVPGLEPPKIAVDAEIEALKRGVGSKYPPFDGIPELKREISRFVKNPGCGHQPGTLLSHGRVHAGLLYGHDVHHPALQGQEQDPVPGPRLPGEQTPGRRRRRSL